MGYTSHEAPLTSGLVQSVRAWRVCRAPRVFDALCPVGVGTAALRLETGVCSMCREPTIASSGNRHRLHSRRPAPNPPPIYIFSLKQPVRVRRLSKGQRGRTAKPCMRALVKSLAAKVHSSFPLSFFGPTRSYISSDVTGKITLPSRVCRMCVGNWH